MIDNNGVYTILDLNTAQGMVLEKAVAAGIDVQSGSVEEQIANYLAQVFILFDSGLFRSYQLQFNPVGSDIDLQNPNTPRLQPGTASGYILLTNDTASPIDVSINVTFTAPNGNSYTTGNNSVTVPAMDTATISVESVEKGKDQNLPSGQAFTVSLDLTATNPQPFTNGRDLETDTEYLNRIVWLQTNNTSQQATAEAIKELEDFYQSAQIYVNNTSNALPDPVPVPPNGYIAIVQFPSGAEAGADEIQKALQIIANRLEFGNTNNNSTSIHPVFGGTIYTGPFPENFYVIPAQAVQSTVNTSLTVKFSPNIDQSEKAILANAFAQFFAQNIVDFFGGAKGEANVIFQSAGSPLPSPDVATVAVNASEGLLRPRIGCSFSIEQIRALISDANKLPQLVNLEYLTCEELSIAIDPLTAGEAVITVDKNGPIETIDFKTTAIFSDYTGWYDRYVFIDPALITVTITET